MNITKYIIYMYFNLCERLREGKIKFDDEKYKQIDNKSLILSSMKI